MQSMLFDLKTIVYINIGDDMQIWTIAIKITIKIFRSHPHIYEIEELD